MPSQRNVLPATIILIIECSLNLLVSIRKDIASLNCPSIVFWYNLIMLIHFQLKVMNVYALQLLSALNLSVAVVQNFSGSVTSQHENKVHTVQ